MKLAALLPVLLPLAAAQAPFPGIATRSLNDAQSSKLVSQISSYVASVIEQPAYTSAVAELEEVGREDNPIDLALAFVTATATPAWYSDLPSDLQSYVSSIAAAEATFAVQDSSDARSFRPAPGSGGQLWMYGAAAGAVLFGAVLL